ncbi:MAG: hypothetical protein R2715_19960 [Ilumatobacteraceae bacterium]
MVVSTEDASSVELAVDLVAPGGRIVLLGSPRSKPARVPVDRLREAQVELAGAHISGLNRLADEDRDAVIQRAVRVVTDPQQRDGSVTTGSIRRGVFYRSGLDD